MLFGPPPLNKSGNTKEHSYFFQRDKKLYLDPSNTDGIRSTKIPFILE